MEERRKILEEKFEEYYQRQGKDFHQVQEIIEKELTCYFNFVDANPLSKGWSSHRLRMMMSHNDIDLSNPEILEYIALKVMETSCLRGDFKNIDLVLLFGIGAVQSLTSDFFKSIENYLIAACLENPGYNINDCFNISENQLVKSLQNRVENSKAMLMEIFNNDLETVQKALEKKIHLTPMLEEVLKLEGTQLEKIEAQNTISAMIGYVSSRQGGIISMTDRCNLIAEEFKSVFLNLETEKIIGKFQIGAKMDIDSFIKNELFKIATADLKFLGKQIDFIEFLLREENKLGLAKIWPDGNQLKENLIKLNLEAKHALVDNAGIVTGSVEGEVVTRKQNSDLVMVPKIDSTNGDDPVLTTAGASPEFEDNS